MCNQKAQDSSVFISSWDRGFILVILAWSSACLLAICTAARVIFRCVFKRDRSLSPLDDAIILTASACALAGTLIVSTAVHSGLGKRNCLLDLIDIKRIRIKIFAANILSILAISMAKCSILLFLHRLADRTIQRACTVIIGGLVILWAVAALSGTVFQCEPPRPWKMWTDGCIPLGPFWTSAIIFDISMEAAILILSLTMTWTQQIQYQQKVFASLLFSLRLLLIAASTFRIVFIRHAIIPTSDPGFSFIPYAIATQIHAALAVIIPCALILPPMRTLFCPSQFPLTNLPSLYRKHWSDTTITKTVGVPYASNTAFAPPEIIREPLPSIQASMSNPVSPAMSRYGVSDKMLPEILLAPRRPPRPSEAQRPDLSMFTRTNISREPPMVTKLERV